MTEVLVGFLIAVSIGISGVGGGTITAPVLMLFLGVKPEIAVGTALLFSIFAKVPAGAVYLRKKQVSWSSLKWLLLGGIPAVVTGSLFLGALKEQKALVLLIVGITVVFCSIVNLVLTFNGKGHTTTFHPAVLVGVAAFIGLEVGFSSAGAGALGTLLLIWGTRLLPKEIVGTDIWFGLALSVVGGLIHAFQGAVDYTLLVKIAAGGFVGSFAGAYIANFVPVKPFRLGLLFWLIYIGSTLIYKGSVQ